MRSRRRALAPRAEALETRDLMAQYVAGELLIQFKSGAADAARAAARGVAEAALAEQIHTGPMRDAGRGILERVTLPAGRPIDVAIRALQNNPNVEFAEPNWTFTHQATSADPYYTDGRLWGMYGDATSPTNSYGSGASEVWAAGQVGLPNGNNDPTSLDFKRRIYVGIIDEGIQHTHPDLDANVWSNPFDKADGVDNDGNGYVDDVRGWDFAGNNNTIYDGTADDHGTHVAGTIAAEGTDQVPGATGQGVVGVNWNVTYIAAKFLGATSGSLANAIKAVDYFTDLKKRHGLNIVATNNSWGGGGYSQGLQDAITRAAQAQILFVAAAGNGGSDQVGDNNDSTANYPSNYDTTAGAGYNAVIAVAAIAPDGKLAGFSNYGAKTVHLGASGVAVNSTLPTNSYGSYNGTSMATPHVTGAVALYAAAVQKTDASGNVVNATARQIRDAILTGVTPTTSLQGKTTTGGRLNIARALGIGETVPTAPAGLEVTGASDTQISLAWLDKSTDESGFRIERSTAGSVYMQVAQVGVNVTSYTASDLKPGTPYSFRVFAYNSAGDSASFAGPATATTKTLVAPSSAPTNLVAKVDSESQITLSWTDTTANELSFDIERSTDGLAYVSVGSAGANATSYVVSELSPNTLYYFRARARNGAGVSPDSNVARVRILTLPFSDGFTGAETIAQDVNWRTLNGAWQKSDGVLKQTSPSGTDSIQHVDPKKAFIQNLASTPDYVKARVRVDAWKDGEYARAGVFLYDKFNLVFTGKQKTGTNKVAFVEDGVRWSATWNFRWSVGAWYTFELQAKGGVLYGWITPDGKARSSTAQFSQSGWLPSNPTGAPGLNGGSEGTSLDGVTSYSTASFDSIEVNKLSSTTPSGAGTGVAVGTQAEPLAAPALEPAPASPRTSPAPAAVDLALEQGDLILEASPEVVADELPYDQLLSRRGRLGWL